MSDCHKHSSHSCATRAIGSSISVEGYRINSYGASEMEPSSCCEVAIFYSQLGIAYSGSMGTGGSTRVQSTVYAAASPPTQGTAGRGGADASLAC